MIFLMKGFVLFYFMYRPGAAIAPPSSLNDEHLSAIDAGKKVVVVGGKSEIAEDSPLSDIAKRLQAIRSKAQLCRESNKKGVIEEERTDAEKQRGEGSGGAYAGKKRKRKELGKGDDKNKFRNVTAEDAQWETKINKKKANASGVMPSPYNEDASYVSFKKRTKHALYSQDEYERQKEELGDKFYPDADSLDVGKVPYIPEENVNRMVRELNTSQVSRYNFSRRRAHNEDKDVDYIHERNKKFNEKLSRAYDKYTVEIRQNLERGTAI